MKKTYKFLLDFDADPDFNPIEVRRKLGEYQTLTLRGNEVTLAGDEAFDFRLRLDSNIKRIDVL